MNAYTYANHGLMSNAKVNIYTFFWAESKSASRWREGIWSGSTDNDVFTVERALCNWKWYTH